MTNTYAHLHTANSLLRRHGRKGESLRTAANNAHVTSRPDAIALLVRDIWLVGQQPNHVVLEISQHVVVLSSECAISGLQVGDPIHLSLAQDPVAHQLGSELFATSETQEPNGVCFELLTQHATYVHTVVG